MVIKVLVCLNPDTQKECLRPYPGHKKGCPNYGRKQGCPPDIKLFEEVFDVSKPVFAIINEFDLGSHVENMRAKHPGWSDRQLRCCLYWQKTARKQLMEKIKNFYRQCEKDIGHSYHVTICPEAMGVDVTSTLLVSGVEMEWPPVKIARQVALAAVPIAPWGKSIIEEHLGKWWHIWGK
jgi:predicted metal-binding protein